MEWQHKIDDLLGDISWFRHEIGGINGIKGLPFLDLSSYCRFDMARVDEEICTYLSKADITNIPMVNGEMPPELHGEFQPFEYQFLGELIDDDLRRKVSAWSPAQRRRYLFFKNKITIPWSFIISLKRNSFVTRAEDLHPWESDVDTYLPYTKAAIASLPFKTIGRVVIYCSWPHMPVPCHRDDVSGPFRDHHINFNPGGARPVYVYHSEARQKLYIPPAAQLYAYNTSDYHGVEAMDRFSYTIRVDGTYLDEILS